MKNRDIYRRRYKGQETLYKGQWCLSPLQSEHLGTSHRSPNHHQLLRCAFLNLIDSLKSLPFQRWFQFGEKPEVTGHEIWAVGGWVTWGVGCFTQNLCTRRDAWAGMLSWWSCQSAVAHGCGLLSHLNSFRRGLLTLNAKYDADFLLYWPSHVECDGHTEHMLTQGRLPPPLTSTVTSSLFTRAHPSPHTALSFSVTYWRAPGLLACLGCCQ